MFFHVLQMYVCVFGMRLRLQQWRYQVNMIMDRFTTAAAAWVNCVGYGVGAMPGICGIS